MKTSQARDSDMPMQPKQEARAPQESPSCRLCCGPHISSSLLHLHDSRRSGLQSHSTRDVEGADGYVDHDQDQANDSTKQYLHPTDQFLCTLPHPASAFKHAWRCPTLRSVLPHHAGGQLCGDNEQGTGSRD